MHDSSDSGVGLVYDTDSEAEDEFDGAESPNRGPRDGDLQRRRRRSLEGRKCSVMLYAFLHPIEPSLTNQYTDTVQQHIEARL